MTGPEHYQRAEQLLKDANTPYTDLDVTLRLIAAAQAHATLAIAAAQALSIATSGIYPEAARTEWTKAVTS